MALRPNNWIEEDRETFADSIATALLEQMSDKEKDRLIWDILFEELMNKDWPELWSDAEEYAPHLVDPISLKATF